MYQEGAPEFVIDQGMYYPTPTNYGYYCTGFESPVELEDHQNFFSADGSDVQYAGAQNETLSYVYYTPGYGYAQPGYNAYNSYIPGAVMSDSPFVGAQQYYTIPPYQNHVSPTAYVPVYIQPDGIPSTSVSAAFSRKSAPNQADFLRRATDGQSKHYGFQGGVPDSSGSASAQAHQVRVASGSVQPGGKLHTWEEQNRDPRTSRSKNQLMVKSYTSKAGNSDAEGNIIIFTDQYNKDNFPVDYVDAKFFVIKSYSEDDVHKSIKYNVWSSTPHGNKNLDVAHEDAQKIAAAKHSGCPIFLFFSVNASGQFCGVAEMIGPVDFQKDMDFWQQNKWSGSFPVKWHIIKNVPNSHFRHIILGNNENKPVTNSRDTQEIMFKQGMEMLKVFKNHAMKTSLLDVFMYYENRQRIMHEEKTMQPIKSFESPVIARAFGPANKWNRVELLRNENVRSTRPSGPELLRTIAHSSTQHGSTDSGTTNGNTTNGSLEQFAFEAKDHAFTSKMSALSLNPKLSESEFPTDASVKTDSADVVNVGSVTVKVNRFTESPGFLTVGTIPLNPKTLQLDQDGVDAKSCT